MHTGSKAVKKIKGQTGYKAVTQENPSKILGGILGRFVFGTA